MSWIYKLFRLKTAYVIDCSRISNICSVSSLDLVIWIPFRPFLHMSEDSDLNEGGVLPAYL